VDLRPTSNAAAAPKIGNPEGCFLEAAWLRCSSVRERLRLSSFVAPCQPASRKQRAHSLFMRWVLKTFKNGDHVRWNSEAGRVSGTIIAIHKKDFRYKGYVHHATETAPQYEIKSDKSDHIAAHKGGALRRIASRAKGKASKKGAKKGWG